MNLNPKQEEAKKYTEWALLILAWAWSWKTATLTARVQYMISEKQINPSSILMVTFTNKAAKEMRDRVSKTLWIEAPRWVYEKFWFPLIGTFHSIWIYILKQTLKSISDIDYSAEVSERIWLKKDFVIYDESDKLSVLKKIIKEDLNLEEKEYPARKVWSYISNAKNSLLTARAYQSSVDNPFKEVVYEAYLKYEETLAKNNAIDFDDILLKLLNLFRIEKILSIYQEKFRYLMVDEYQDTNALQYEIIRLLASKYKNLAVVWDDSQSIYSWRSADYRNILNFKKDYKDALVIKLEQNYRSTKTILSWANAVIANNETGIKKKLWTDNNTWEKIKLIEAFDDKTEALIISDIIKSNNENFSYKDNLILYRTNAQSRQLEEHLLMASIPYKVIWWLKFYDRKEIKDILAYLKFIFNPSDKISTKRIINTPSRKIWAKTIEILDNYSESFDLSYLSILENIDEVEELKAWAKKSLFDFFTIYNALSLLSHKISVSKLIESIIEKTWYENYLREWFSSEEFDSKMDNIKELINLASEYDNMDPRDSLEQFLEEVALITDMDYKDETSDYVSLMTVHTSKWLEAPRVFLTWLEEGIFPSFRSVSDNEALEEERRLMYVAMTRAEKELYISRAKQRFYFWDFVSNPESRFLSEIPESCLEDHKTDTVNSYFARNDNLFNQWVSSPAPKIKSRVNNNDISQFSMWDKVSHNKFWNGIITSLKWEIADIAFSWIWIKKMNIRLAPINKR